MQAKYPVKASEPEVTCHLARFVGGTAACTAVTESGMAVAYSATGTYTLTWTDDPGTFVGFSYGLQAATPANIAGHTVIMDTWDSTNLIATVVVYNASDAAHDLAANEWATLQFYFSKSGVTGA